MRANRSKSALLYRQLRRALQSGRYLPGQRIDPGTLAEEFSISPTPVRFALYRLVGEGLIDDHARDGLHVPLLTEVALRDLYDWMERLLLMACEVEAPPAVGAGEALPYLPGGPRGDPVKGTWQLFDAIARAPGFRPLHHTVKQANDRLAPVRRAKRGLIDQPDEELARLGGHWQASDMAALRAGLRAYHARRRQLVPRIVALLVDRRDQQP